MQISQNPTDEKINELISLSKDKAAKWIKDLDTNDVYYWPSDTSSHKKMSLLLHIDNYDKGIAINQSLP